MEDVCNLLLEGYVLYASNGKIEVVKPPEYGVVTLKFQDSKPVREEILQTKKVV